MVQPFSHHTSLQASPIAFDVPQKIPGNDTPKGKTKKLARTFNRKYGIVLFAWMMFASSVETRPIEAAKLPNCTEMNSSTHPSAYQTPDSVEPKPLHGVGKGFFDDVMMKIIERIITNFIEMIIKKIIEMTIHLAYPIAVSSIF